MNEYGAKTLIGHTRECKEKSRTLYSTEYNMCGWMPLGWVAAGRVVVSEKLTPSLATASHTTFPSASCCQPTVSAIGSYQQ